MRNDDYRGSDLRKRLAGAERAIAAGREEASATGEQGLGVQAVEAIAAILELVGGLLLGAGQHIGHWLGWRSSDPKAAKKVTRKKG